MSGRQVNKKINKCALCVRLFPGISKEQYWSALHSYQSIRYDILDVNLHTTLEPFLAKLVLIKNLTNSSKLLTDDTAS